MERLRAAGDLAVAPKQAWTPVAEFGLVGVDAVNFGPGDPQYAHRDDEQVEVVALVRSYEVLRAFLRTGNASDREERERVVHLSPGLRASEPYPFEELDRRKAAALADGRPIVDFGVGDPREETPAFIREALKDAIEPTSSYPRAAGLPELRGAIASWVERRFGTTLDPDVHILPTLGSKEPIFSLAQSLLDPEGGKHLVTVTSPGLHDPRARRAVRRRATSPGCRSPRPTDSSPTSTPWTPPPGAAPPPCG